MTEVQFPRRSGRRKPTAVRTGVDRETVRVAIYTRISTDESNQTYSLEAQRKYLEQFVGSQATWVQTHFFTDQFTGTTLNRPGLRAALQAATDGEYDVLLAYRVDRFGRKQRLLLELVSTLESCGVAIRSATEVFDTSNAMGRMTMGLLGTFAEFERDSLVDRIIQGNSEKASRGAWVGGKPPYGYRVGPDKATLIQEPVEAIVVKRIFSDYLVSRAGAMAITLEMNSEGLRTASGRHWSAKAVLDILRRPTYAGYIVHHDKVYEGRFVPIVDRETFEAAQKLLDDRGEVSRRRVSDSDFLLTGLVKCTACSGSYAGSSAHSKSGIYRYYQCMTRTQSGAAACMSKRVRADALETAVVELVVETYGRYDIFEKAAAEAAVQGDYAKAEARAQLPSVLAAIEKATAALQRYQMAFEDGSLEVGVFKTRLADLRNLLAELEAQKLSLHRAISANPLAALAPDSLEKTRKRVKRLLSAKPTQRSKAFLAQIVDHIDLGPDRTATPVLRLPSAEDAPSKGGVRTIVRVNEQGVELGGIEPPSISR